MEFIGIYNINQQFTEFIEGITSNVLNLVWNSGIQILIFLSALQNIPPSSKEAANMEGATAWEFFWKVTFPIVRYTLGSHITIDNGDNGTCRNKHRQEEDCSRESSSSELLVQDNRYKQ